MKWDRAAATTTTTTTKYYRILFQESIADESTWPIGFILLRHSPSKALPPTKELTVCWPDSSELLLLTVVLLDGLVVLKVCTAECIEAARLLGIINGLNKVNLSWTYHLQYDTCKPTLNKIRFHPHTWTRPSTPMYYSVARDAATRCSRRCNC